MSKRFEVDVDHLLLVWDTEKNKRLEIEDVVGVLNEQQDIIFKLQDLCGESDGENAKLRIKNKRLQAENEELRFALRAEQALAKIQNIK